MNTIKLGQIGFLVTLEMIILHILVVLVLNILVLKLLSDRSTKEAILEFQAYNSIMCGYFCIGFIDYMFNNKRLIDLASTPCYFTFDKKNLKEV